MAGISSEGLMITPTPCTLREDQQSTGLILGVLKVNTASLMLMMVIALRDGTGEHAALLMTAKTW